MIQISMPPSLNLMLPRKQSSCSVILILTFSGYSGQGKTRFLREKISVILCKYLKMLVFFLSIGALNCSWFVLRMIRK